eukprot:1120159-Rhodomonas_salina.1
MHIIMCGIGIKHHVHKADRQCPLFALQPATWAFQTGLVACSAAHHLPYSWAWSRAWLALQLSVGLAARLSSMHCSRSVQVVGSPHSWFPSLVLFEEHCRSSLIFTFSKLEGHNCFCLLLAFNAVQPWRWRSYASPLASLGLGSG